MKTYIVHFVGMSGTSFKVAEYKSKKAIRRAQDRYDNEYGSCLSLRILDKETLQEVRLSEVA